MTLALVALIALSPGILHAQSAPDSSPHSVQFVTVDQGVKLDVLAVIDALNLAHSILAGHSIPGEELSSIGSRHPEKVARLIYLDAALPCAYYNHSNNDWTFDMQDVRKQIDAIQAGAVLEPKFVDDLLVSLDQAGKDMHEIKEALALQKPPNPPPPPPIGLAIHFGQQKYTQTPVPILAIVVGPHNFDRVNAAAAAKAAMVADDRARCTAQADAFAAGLPSAHVVRLPKR